MRTLADEPFDSILATLMAASTAKRLGAIFLESA
jgi:hypothetical protein